MQLFRLLQLFRLSNGFTELKRKGKLIRIQLTSSIGLQSLILVIDELLNDLQKHVELIRTEEIELMKSISLKSESLSKEFNESGSKVSDHLKTIHSTVEGISEQATKIKAEIF